MKNEGWGFKEDQIPSSSHYSHQTMDSQLHLFLMLSTYKFRLVAFNNLLLWARLTYLYVFRHILHRAHIHIEYIFFF